MLDFQSRFSRFQIKIFKYFLAFSLLIVLLFSALSFYLLFTSQKNNIKHLQRLSVDNANEKIENYVNQKKEFLHLVINTKFMAQGEMEKLREYMEIMDSIEQDGAQTRNSYKVYFSPDSLFQVASATVESLIDSIQASTGALSVSFIDISGEEAAIRPAGSREKAYVGEEEYFKQALKDKYYFGPVEYGSGRPTIKISAQIEAEQEGGGTDSKTKVIGVIAADIDLTPIKDIISKITLGKTGFVYVLSSDGKIIASSNNNLTNSYNNLSSQPYIQKALSGQADNDVRAIKNVLGDSALFYSARFDSDFSRLVASEWPKDDAYSILYRLVFQTLIIILISLALIVAISLIIARHVVRPIEALAEGARQISKGNLDYRVDLKTDDEFELLAGEYNEMVKVLNENRRLKDEFVFIAAHELRTPVTAIKGYLSMLMDGTFGKLEKTVIDNLATVYNANERLVQLVQDLLEVARSESGKMKIEPKNIPLEENITSVIKELSPLADKKGIRIDYTPLADKYFILADSGKFKEVLINLIGNAIKYTLTGGGIAISNKVEDGFVITSICDHGIGMSEEAVKNLFSKFYRVKTAETENIEGTGLGLFICKEIMERMGGSIWAVSKEGTGSTFSFKLKISS